MHSYHIKHILLTQQASTSQSRFRALSIQVIIKCLDIRLRIRIPQRATLHAVHRIRKGDPSLSIYNRKRPPISTPEANLPLWNPVKTAIRQPKAHPHFQRCSQNKIRPLSLRLPDEVHRRRLEELLPIQGPAVRDNLEDLVKAPRIRKPTERADPAASEFGRYGVFCVHATAPECAQGDVHRVIGLGRILQHRRREWSWRDHLSDPGPFALVLESQVEVCVQRRGEFVADEVWEWFAAGAVDEFTQQQTLRHEVVARRSTWFPPGFLGDEFLGREGLV